MARKKAQRQRRERLAGVAVIVLGIAVAIVAVLALQSPSNNRSASGPNSSAPASTSSSPGQRSPSPTPSAGRSSTSPSGTPTSPSTAPTTPAPSGSPATSIGAASRVKDIPLVVLNNTTTSGLASQAAARFESGGWKVTSSGNLQNNIISTCAYYDPSVSGAQAAAEALQKQYPTIKRVKEKFPQLPAGPIVVVLTPGYSSN